MKTKTYWKNSRGNPGPFDVPNRVSKGVSQTARKFSRLEDGPPTVKYVWIYVTEDGLRAGQEREDVAPAMELEGWLNILDESASLGAEWLVIYVGASFDTCPEIWELCRWAQDTHGIKTGIHVGAGCLNDEDIERLKQLDPSKLFLALDKSCMKSLSYLKESGIRLCESNARPYDEPDALCTIPESITCVRVDGGLYTCGLVLGDKRYAMGNVQGRSLAEVMVDKNLPHTITDVDGFPEGGCDACPAHMARRFLELSSA